MFSTSEQGNQIFIGSLDHQAHDLAPLLRVIDQDRFLREIILIDQGGNFIDPRLGKSEAEFCLGCWTLGQSQPGIFKHQFKWIQRGIWETSSGHCSRTSQRAKNETQDYYCFN
jgi:hypothetical protein